MAGAGTIGVGGAGSGVGVGGWQLYEQVINPTLHTQLSKENYQYQPAHAPLNEQVLTDANNKYNWRTWGCVDRLFPTLKGKIQHKESTSSTSKPFPTISKEVDGWTVGERDKEKVRLDYYLPTPNLKNNLVSCALFDWRGGSDASQEKIYFKSEVVVKDENYGWVMWNGLSSDPSSTSQKVDFEYRLLTFKKEGNEWKIDRGFGWSTPVSSDSNAQDQLEITIPQGHHWKEVNNNSGAGYSTRKIWSGIAKLDKSANQHMVESLQIYMWSKNSSHNSSSGVNYNAEFFGKSGGKWYGDDRGYTKVNKMYVDNQGWHTFSPAIDLSLSLNAWYQPFIGQKIRWITCGEWSIERKSGSNMSLVDQEIRNVCYSPKSTTVN